MARYVGIDMTDVDEVRESLRMHGDHYLERVYTEDERRDCGTSTRRLAERFAAKEATMHSVAVGRDAAGRPALVLSGPAADLARERGIGRLSVSFSAVATHTVAIVLATS
jgi:holo-[acyl-carrier protein] synthase